MWLLTGGVWLLVGGVCMWLLTGGVFVWLLAGGVWLLVGGVCVITDGWCVCVLLLIGGVCVWLLIGGVGVCCNWREAWVCKFSSIGWCNAWPTGRGDGRPMIDVSCVFQCQWNWTCSRLVLSLSLSLPWLSSTLLTVIPFVADFSYILS